MRRLGRLFSACLLAVGILFPGLTAGQAARADEPTTSPTLVGIQVDPPKVALTGPDGRYTLLVSGERADGRMVDVTHLASFRALAPQVVQVTARGEVMGLADGQTSIQVEVAGRQQKVEVQVTGSQTPRHFNFDNDIEPLLARFGCNSSGCHGKAEGQNGFKLSVFGFDPKADFDALTKQGRGRRVFPAAAEQSLLLRKAAGIVPHGGGARIAADSLEYSILRDWIAAGLPFGDENDPKVVSVKITPHERQLDMGSQQQLRVVARYGDGREVDVTNMARYQSNRESLAVIDETGLVTTGDTPGQVAIMASYMGAVDVFEGLIPRALLTGSYPQLPENNFIDGLVYARLKKLNIIPSGVCTDAEFLRRAYLDVIGTLPTAQEARKFLTDSRADRRARLVDELLMRPEFADYWALKWADVLRVDREALGHKGAYAYYKWIHDSLAENKPLDRFVREVITAEGPLADVPQAQLYKAISKPTEMASTVSQVFLGVRIACAECHHHPFDRWSQDDFFGMQDFFTPLSRKPSPRGEVILANAGAKTKHTRTGEIVLAHALDTPMPAELPPGDNRKLLADWMTSPKNPWFARHMANRVWAHFLGRGLVDPVDDVRATNPPSNPELLTALAQYLTAEKYDVRQLIRAITASRVYQLSSEPNETNERDEHNYSRALFKRLDAEVLLDAVCQTTGIGEKFQGVPNGSRAIQLWDSKVPHYFLKLFGRPVRLSACECERNAEPSVAQVLHCLNSTEIQAKLAHEAGTVGRLVEQIGDDAALVDELYLTFYNRFPTDAEKQTAVEYIKNSTAGRRRGAEDIAWSMLNSLEFVFNH
jgi:hypothetical protein